MQPDLNLTIIFQLFLASVLGGIIGLERELHHKPAGLRTNMFICVGATLFTILSAELSREFGGDHTRIAAQIIPGIGFIGAGMILRDRGSVIGLTSAATIFVNASIGMAIGGRLYWTAAYATLMLLGALSLLGMLEVRLIRSRIMVFRVTAADPEPAMKAVNAALTEMKIQMQRFQIFRVGADFVMEFQAGVTHAQQQKLIEQLGALSARCEAVPRDTTME
jgi:putative Mg2+ transporter-C (MgtC) family protein